MSREGSGFANGVTNCEVGTGSRKMTRTRERNKPLVSDSTPSLNNGLPPGKDLMSYGEPVRSCALQTAYADCCKGFRTLQP
jgi:hypothetical protein